LADRGAAMFKIKVLVCVGVALGLGAVLLCPQPAMATTAGWTVHWVESPAAGGQPAGGQLSADAGRVVYQTSDAAAVVLYDASCGTTTMLTPPETQAGAPVIEGDWVAWVGWPSAVDTGGLFLHRLSGGDDRRVAVGQTYGDPILRGGRVLWLGGSNECNVLNLYDIASDTNTRLNEGTWGWSLPLLLSDSWVVWREHDAEVLFAYDIRTGEKHEYPEAGTARLYAIIGDQVAVSVPSGPEAAPAQQRLALFDLSRGVLTDIAAASGSSISSLAADEAAGRLAWTAMDAGGAFVAVYDVAEGSLQRVPMPYHQLGAVAIAGDTVLFRAQAHEGILTPAPPALFAWSISHQTLTELGQQLPELAFATDSTRAYFISTVLANNGWPRLAPHSFLDWSPSIVSSKHLFVATAPTTSMEPFADVSGLHPYRTAIVSLSERGAVSGYKTEQGAAFGLDEPCLRAQFAKMMVEALGVPVDESLKAPFWDLGPDDPGSLYPHDYVAAAYTAGLITGFPDGSFRPWQPANRAQLVTLTVRAAQNLRPGLLLSTPEYYTSLLGSFDQAHARNLVVAEDNGLMDGLLGYGHEWDPWRTATRGESAQLLWNLLRTDLKQP